MIEFNESLGSDNPVSPGSYSARYWPCLPTSARMRVASRAFSLENNMQVCKVCKIEKPFDDFYKHKNMLSGYLTTCKKCKNKRTRDNWNNLSKEKKLEISRNRTPNKEAKLKYSRSEKAKNKQKNYINTEKGKEVRKKACLNWIEKNKKKRQAHNAISIALRNKTISKLPCFVCGNSEVEAHHPNYDAPLDVIWLCTKHHAQLHLEARRMK